MSPAKNVTPAVIAIIGPTSSGKSALGVLLAKHLGGEVISADSRQVYKGLNIGTGKITNKEMGGIPHHLLDVISPKKVWSVAEWKSLAQQKIEQVLNRGNVPIICGGTGFYIDTLLQGLELPSVPPNIPLRKKLEILPISELQKILKKLDAKRYATIDTQNPVRLIRAIEIAKTLGKVPQLISKPLPYRVCWIGLNPTQNILQKRIHLRLQARIRQGLVAEGKKLHARGLSYTRMRQLGLEYMWLADLLERKITHNEFVGGLERDIVSYAKRQMRWFKRNKDITWFSKPNISQMVKLFNTPQT